MINNVDRFSGLWAMERRALQNFVAAAKPKVDQGDDDDGDSPVAPLVPNIIKGTAIIPVTGMICKYASIWTALFGGTSSLQLKNCISQCVADPNVTSIVLWIDSPGGQAAGTEECANAIAECPKPIVAVASDACCSGAYWLASQCDKIYANKSAFVGSIGVYQLWADTSKMYADAGITMKLVRSGDKKGVGADGIPISDEDLATLQVEVDDLYAVFTQAVAAGRSLNVPIAQVANGDVFIAEKALGMGLIDAIGDVDDALSDLASKEPTFTQIYGNGTQTNALQAKVTEGSMTTNAKEQAAKTEVAVAAPVVEAKTETAVSVAAPVDVEAIKAEAYAAAKKDEQARFDAVLKACGGRHELAVSHFAAGHSAAEAIIAYAAALEAENKNLQAGVISAGTNPVATVGATATTQAPNFDAEWEANDNDCRKVFSGKKEWFVRHRKDQIAAGAGK